MIKFDEFINEATLKKSAKEEKTGSQLSVLMRALNKNEKFNKARLNLAKAFQSEAKKVAAENNIPLKVLDKVKRISMGDLLGKDAA